MFLLFIIPFISALIIFLFPIRLSKEIRKVTIGLAFLPLFVLLMGGVQKWLGKEILLNWIPSLSIDFHLMIDSLSLLFLYLVAFIVPLSLFATKEDISIPKFFYICVLILEGLLIGFFTARDLVLFTIFWEAMLIPLYFIMTIKGTEDAQAAALKFLMYMIAGSALMIGAVLALYVFSSSVDGLGTFNLNRLIEIKEKIPHASLLFAIFFLAFAVKTPLFPFHAWLPDTYYFAPTTGTILLSALLSKAGIYGFFRIGIGLFPTLMHEWGPFFMSLAIIGVIYGGLGAWSQSDYKRLIAYSSFSHVNFILAGIFAWSQMSHQGALLQAVNHGITITGLFLVAGWLEKRLSTTQLFQFGGMGVYLPHLCWLTLVFVLASVALPGTNNFVGELMILFGVFGQNRWLTAILGLTVILSALYMLRWMQKVYFESPKSFREQWTDIGLKELLISLPLIALIFWIGLYPSPLLNLVTLTTEKDNISKLEEK